MRGMWADRTTQVGPTEPIDRQWLMETRLAPSLCWAKTLDGQNLLCLIEITLGRDVKSVFKDIIIGGYF